VTPNVTGQIISIPVKPNVPVKANDVLFQIDPAPFPVQGRAIASVACRGEATDRDLEVELRAGYRECRRSGASAMTIDE
jgi:multidrug resistance efflux pump